MKSGDSSLQHLLAPADSCRVALATLSVLGAAQSIESVDNSLISRGLNSFRTARSGRWIFKYPLLYLGTLSILTCPAHGRRWLRYVPEPSCDAWVCLSCARPQLVDSRASKLKCPLLSRPRHPSSQQDIRQRAIAQ